jgi:thioester reductase-like protein
MQYFITGASGFIGRRLVKKLLAREDSTIYFLVRAAEKESLANLYDFWECDAKRAIPVVGDLTEPLLGVAAVDRKKLGKKTHTFSTWRPSMISRPMPTYSSRSMLRARATR